MKARICLLCLWASAVLVFAGEYKTVVIPAGEVQAIKVDNDGFILLRNFTQEGGMTRGLVKISTDSGDVSVLAATIIEGDASNALEAVNSIIIAGKGVTASCPADAMSCVLTYRKTNGED